MYCVHAIMHSAALKSKALKTVTVVYTQNECVKTLHFNANTINVQSAYPKFAVTRF